MRAPFLTPAATTAAALLLAISSAPSTSAAAVTPRSPLHNGEGITIPLTRRAVVKDFASFKRKAEHLKAKYASPSEKRKRKNEKRSTSASLAMTNYEDVEYYGTIQVGSQQQKLSVILDTGSADLILATSPCTGCSSATPLYLASASTTSQTSTDSFSITYGTGDASGTLAADTVSIAGLSVSNQVFAACTTIDNILSGSISGLLGLGWKQLSESGATPLVQALAQNGSLSSDLFAFAFTTYPETGTIKETAAGGTMTIGAVDTTKFSGTINWVDVVSPESYWMIPLQAVHAGGVDLGLTASSVVVDSGTSLVGVPTAAAEAIYAQISGGAAVTEGGGRGGGEQVTTTGYYSYTCSASVNVTFTFGGVTYNIPTANFNSGYLDNSGTTCLGAIFAMDSSSSVQWIFGDSFLNGVYSVFRFSPTASVGFATLGSGGSAGSSSNSSAAVATGGSSSSTTSGAAAAITGSGSFGTVSVGTFSIPLVALFAALAVGYQAL